MPSTGIVSQLCGDAHVRNLGAYAAPDGRLVFDINDFDETIRGPFEWDLKRMAASLVLAGRAAGHKDMLARKAAEACVDALRASRCARSPACRISKSVDSWCIASTLREPVHAALSKAERATPQHTLEHLTCPPRPKPEAPRRFKESKPMLTRITGSRAAAVLASLGPYREMLEPQRQHLLSFYRPVDVAFKVVGTGSVGLRDYCIYMEGNGPRDPLFLQIKEEAASAYAPYLPDAHPRRTTASASPKASAPCRSRPIRFSAGRTSAAASISVRQLNDHKGSIEIEDLAGANLEATPKSAASCSRAATPAPATRKSSPATSARRARLSKPWPSSASPTPTRRKKIGSS